MTNRTLWWFPVSLVVILIIVGAVLLAQPAVTVNVTVPSIIMENTQLTAVVQLDNNLRVPVDFEGTIFVYGKGWGGETFPYTFSEGTEVQWLECNTKISANGCKIWWRGTIPPGGKVTFKLPTKSGNENGTFPFVMVLFNTTEGPLQQGRALTVIP